MPAPHRGTNARARRQDRHRRGAAMVETAITLMVFVTLVLGMLDLGLAVFRQQILSYAARRGVREAIVHGEFADRLGKWGPAQVSGTLDALTHPIKATLEPYVFGMNPQEVTVQVSWPDGSNQFKKRVQVTLTASYAPILTSLFGNIAIPLSAASTMAIAH